MIGGDKARRTGRPGEGQGGASECECPSCANFRHRPCQSRGFRLRCAPAKTGPNRCVPPNAAVAGLKVRSLQHAREDLMKPGRQAGQAGEACRPRGRATGGYSHGYPMTRPVYSPGSCPGMGVVVEVCHSSKNAKAGVIPRYNARADSRAPVVHCSPGSLPMIPPVLSGWLFYAVLSLAVCIALWSLRRKNKF
jgi:hypothetical protein